MNENKPDEGPGLVDKLKKIWADNKRRIIAASATALTVICVQCPQYEPPPVTPPPPPIFPGDDDGAASYKIPADQTGSYLMAQRKDGLDPKIVEGIYTHYRV